MKLISWNVNGIRAAQRHGFEDFVRAAKPDVLCLQETKATPEQVELPSLNDYYAHWNCAEKKGYSGTAIFTKKKPLSVSLGIGKKAHDTEGRVVTAEFEDFFLITVYVPNSQRELARLDYRMDWDKAFLSYAKKLNKTKPVVFCGDLNVAHKEIDLKNPKSNKRNAGFTDEERGNFDKIVAAGFVDSFREFNQEPDQYSWWSYRMGARKRNIGWRIDYWMVSDALAPKMKSSEILPEVMGSDHCPVQIVFKRGMK